MTASADVYVAQCSNLDLRARPAAWDVGCTGGSPAATELSWTGWGSPRAVATGKIRRRYDTTGEFHDRIYPLFDGRVTLSRIKRMRCDSRPRQYTRAKIEWTVPTEYAAYDTPGPRSFTHDIGKPCPVYVLGEEDNGIFDGIGVAHPRRFLSLMGFESFFNLKWNGWGRKQATARGRFSNGRDPSRPVRLVAFERGTNTACAKDNAYSKLRIKVAGQPELAVPLCQR